MQTRLESTKAQAKILLTLFQSVDIFYSVFMF